MKVILLQDVANVGARGAVVDVKDGYAYNFLIPKGLAKFATASDVIEASKIERRKVTQKQAAAKDLDKVLKQLDGERVTVSGAVNDKGHLFAKVQTDAIAEAVMNQHGHTLTSEHIHIPAPIKEIGEHAITVGTENTTVAMTVVVEAATQTTK